MLSNVFKYSGDRVCGCGCGAIIRPTNYFMSRYPSMVSGFRHRRYDTVYCISKGIFGWLQKHGGKYYYSCESPYEINKRLAMSIATNDAIAVIDFVPYHYATGVVLTSHRQYSDLCESMRRRI